MFDAISDVDKNPDTGEERISVTVTKSAIKILRDAVKNWDKFDEDDTDKLKKIEQLRQEVHDVHNLLWPS